MSIQGYGERNFRITSAPTSTTSSRKCPSPNNGTVPGTSSYYPSSYSSISSVLQINCDGSSSGTSSMSSLSVKFVGFVGGCIDFSSSNSALKFRFACVQLPLSKHGCFSSSVCLDVGISESEASEERVRFLINC